MIFIFYLLSLFELLVIFVIVYRFYRKTPKKRLILFNPFIFYSICWLFLYNLIPLLMVYCNNYYYEDTYSSESIIISKFLIIIFYFTTYVFYKINHIALKVNRLRFSRIINKLKFTENLLLNTYYAFTLIVSLLYIKYIFSFGIGTYLQNRILINRGLGVVSLIIYSSNILILVLFINAQIKEKYSLLKVFKKVFIYLSIVLFSVIYLLIGSRLSVILLVIQILFAFAFLKEKITRRFVRRSVIVMFALTLMLSYFGFMRIRIKMENTDLISEFAKVYVEKITYNLVVNFGKFENIVWMNENYKSWNVLYGKTFMAGFTNVIPRKIWKNKPLGGGPHLRNWIIPGSYDINSKSAKNITSYTTGLATEAYMNFHVFGFIIVPFLLSLFLVLLKRMLDSLDGNVIGLSIYIYLLLSICFVFQYGEFLGIFSRTLFTIFPFMIIKFLGKYKFVI